jgi:hypothetical protein
MEKINILHFFESAVVLKGNMRFIFRLLLHLPFENLLNLFS